MKKLRLYIFNIVILTGISLGFIYSVKMGEKKLGEVCYKGRQDP